jgi:hypothetical protein
MACQVAKHFACHSPSLWSSELCGLPQESGQSPPTLTQRRCVDTRVVAVHLFDLRERPTTYRPLRSFGYHSKAIRLHRASRQVCISVRTSREVRWQSSSRAQQRLQIGGPASEVIEGPLDRGLHRILNREWLAI